MDGTLLTVVLVLAALVVTVVLAILSVRSARRLSQGTFSPVVVWVVLAVVALIVGVGLFGLAVTTTTTTESFTEPASMTGDFKATPAPRKPGMVEGENCWSVEAAVDSRSVANFQQWRYAQLVEWCGDGSQIVGAPKSVRSWDSFSPFWDFERYHDDSETQWDDRYFAYSQVKFEFCAVGKYFCILEDNPALKVTSFGNGTYNVGYQEEWAAGEERTQVLRTSLWEALVAALAGLMGASPLAVILMAVGYVATRSKMDGLRSAGVGLMAGAMTLVGVFAVAAFLIA